MLHRVCGLAGLRGVLSGGRLHVLGSGRRPPTVRPNPDRPHSVYRLQEVHQQGTGWMLPGWLSMGRDCDGRYRRSGERSRRNVDLIFPAQHSLATSQPFNPANFFKPQRDY